MPRRLPRLAMTLLFFTFFLASPVLAGAAFPVVVGADNTICPAGNGLVERFVGCIQQSISAAVMTTLAPISAFMGGVVAIACTLAILLFGFRAASGNQQKLTATTVTLGIKMGAVVVFTASFGEWFPTLLAVIDDLVGASSQYMVISVTLQCPLSVGIWQRVDCALDQIVGGILPGSVLAQGMLGFVVANIFSGPIGFSIFLTSLMFIFMIINAMAKSIYLFLSAYIGIALLVVFSPLIIPLILFKVTKAKFEKWLQLLIGVMLQPLFLFAYLTMLLAAFDVVVFTGQNSLYRTIAGPAATAPGFRMGQYMMDTGAYVDSSAVDFSVNFNPREVAPAIGAGGGKFLDGGVVARRVGIWADNLADRAKLKVGNNIPVDFRVSAIDYPMLAAMQGMTFTTYSIRVVIAVFVAAMVAYILMALLDFIPYLGARISGEIMSVPDLHQLVKSDLASLGKGLTPGGGGGGGPKP